MERVLTQRYENFTEGKYLTYVTTNLLPEDLEEHYGSRLAERAKEMFNLIFVDGISRRRNPQWKE